jgi:hypothetical protein
VVLETRIGSFDVRQFKIIGIFGPTQLQQQIGNFSTGTWANLDKVFRMNAANTISQIPQLR